MTDFPRFFEEHAVLPEGIAAPTDVDIEEDEWFDERRDEPPLDTDIRQGGPPDWLYPAMNGRDEADEILDLEVPELEAIEIPSGEEFRWEGPSGRFYPQGSPGTDAVATYSPWHFYGDGWGIDFWASAFRDFVRDIAFLARQPMATVEPFVFHQVLEHEWTHFEFEVVGTELDRLLSTPCYRTYLFWRFRCPTPWSDGPLEEAVATWHEMRFAQRRRPKRPPGYAKAVRRLNEASPPGYRDWRCMKDRRGSDLVLTTIEALIANTRPWTARRTEASSKELAQVPVRWHGDTSLLPSFVVPKKIGRPTVRQLRKWLRKNGAVIDPRRGKGSHEGFEWNGRTGTYSTSRDPVPKAESEQIARTFGLRGAGELYDAITAGRVIGPPIGAS